MSLAPAKNPIPKREWAEIIAKLADYGVKVKNIPIGIVDEVGDEYAGFCVLYALPREG